MDLAEINFTMKDKTMELGKIQAKQEIRMDLMKVI